MFFNKNKKKILAERNEAMEYWGRADKIIYEQKEKIEKNYNEIKNLKSEKIGDQLEINELKNKLNNSDKLIKKIEDQLNESDKNVSDLKERLGEVNSDWHVEAGLAWRYHPTTKKLEKYKVPKNFDIENVTNKDFNFETQMVKFSYKEDEGSTYGKDYEIPISLYTYMGSKLFSPPDKKKTDHNFYITIDDLKEKIVEKGGNIQSKNIDLILKFLLDNQGKIFISKEFCKKCNINSRQSGGYYLKKLIEWDLIKKVKRGAYKSKKM